MWRVIAEHHPTDFVGTHVDRVPPGDLGTIHQYLTLPTKGCYWARQYDAESDRHPCQPEPVGHRWSFDPSATRA